MLVLLANDGARLAIYRTEGGDDVDTKGEFMERNSSYPTIQWIKSRLRWSYPRVRYPILAAYIVGSEARGEAKSDSDLDIALIIRPVHGKTALKFTERYHQKQIFLPKWNGREVDFEFFYATDPELLVYSKISIHEPASDKINYA